MTYADETPKGYTVPTATASAGVCEHGHHHGAGQHERHGQSIGRIGTDG